MSKPNGTRAAELASLFKQQAQAARKEVDLPIPGIPGAPDFKFRCVLRRIDILTLIRNSSLPEHLARNLLGLRTPDKLDDLEGRAREIAAEKAATMTLEDLEAIQAFQREVAVKTCLEPKLVFSPTEVGDDPSVVDLGDCDFAQQIIVALYNYATALSPDVPVATEEGATTLKAVETFRSE